MTPPDSRTFLSRQGVRLGYQGLEHRSAFMAPGTDSVGTLTLRAAQAGDEAAAVAMWQACELVVSYNDPVADFRFALGRSNSDILIAADPAGSIVGTVM